MEECRSAADPEGVGSISIYRQTLGLGGYFQQDPDL